MQSSLPHVDAELDLIVPDWPAPACVRAYGSTRAGGISLAPYAGLNLAAHVGDAEHAVRHNRARFAAALALPAAPVWLDQVHGARVVNAAAQGAWCAAPQADAAYAECPDGVCAVLTADCLPLLLCDEQGSRVAAVHAGWRGLAAGVIEAALSKMGPPSEVLAWLGPAIGPQHFEVGDEVREMFVAHDAEAQHAFRPNPAGRWLADLYQLTRQRLNAQGVTRIYGGEWCTYGESQRFYSYRRDGVTGRMATLIWLSETIAGAVQ